MGRVKEAALFAKVEKKCGIGMDMHKDMSDCCDDEWALEKIEDDQQQTGQLSSPETNYHLLYEVPFNEIIASIISIEDEIEINDSGPPDISEPDLYLLFHNLKIPAALQS